MKKIIGITGGIGSGKSTVARIIECYGFPVFYADKEAKRIYDAKDFQLELEKRWGKDVFTLGYPDFKVIGKIVFENENELKWLNEQIHPFVANSFKVWVDQQSSNLVFKEAAILFESGAWKDCSENITVEADEEVRISRVVTRDGVRKADVEARIAKQWSSDKRISKADYLIYNNQEMVIPQIKTILSKLN